MRFALAIAAATLVLLAAVALFVHQTDRGPATTDPGAAPPTEPARPSGTRTTPAPHSDPTAVEGPTDAVGGGEEGAVRAAVRFLELTEEVVTMTPTDAARAQRAISTTDTADELATEIEHQMTELVAAAPEGIRLWVAPIGSRNVQTPEGYEASIWYAEVVAIGEASATVTYKTISYDLRFEDGRWRMAGSTVNPGPTPAPTAEPATPAVELLSVLDGYDDTLITGQG